VSIIQVKRGLLTPKRVIGPPTLTYTGNSGLLTRSGSAPWTATGASVPIGTAFANRRVYGVFIHAQDAAGFTPILAASIGGINCDVITVLGGGTNALMVLVSAMVPTGTTAAFSIQTSTQMFNNATVFLYSVDATTLISAAAAVTSINNTASGTTASPSLSGVPAGAAVFYGFVMYSYTNDSESISSSNCGLVKDGNWGGSGAGHANNFGGGTATANFTWTTSTTGGSIDMAAVR
jgi:hypothetical protein